MSSSWKTQTIRECLSKEFSGEWGEDPRHAHANVKVLRSTNLDDEGHLDLARGAPRRVSVAHLAEKRLEDGDILLEASGGGPNTPVGRVARFLSDGQGPYLCSNFFRALRPHSAHDSGFLAWRLLQLYRDPVIWRFQQQTTGIINLKVREYLGHVLELPTLPEQRRIAEILHAVDDAIRKTEEVIAKLQQMKQGLLHDLLTLGIDDNGELRDPDRHPEQFKESELGRIPREWQVKPLGSFLLERPKNGLYKAPHEIGNGTLMVGQIAFTPEDSVEFSSARRARVGRAELAQFGLRSGDILVTRVYATVAGVGRPVIVPPCPEDAVYESNMMRVRVDRSCVDPKILHVWMRGYQARSHIRGKASSSNQTSINQQGLVSMLCPIPKADEQSEMVERIEAADRRIGHESMSLAKLRQLKSALADDLLTGRVRIPTPSEPPAP